MRDEGLAALVAILIVASLGIGYLSGSGARGTDTITSVSTLTVTSTTTPASTSTESSTLVNPSSSGWKYSVKGAASAVAFTPDGAYLAVGTQSSTLNGSVYLFEGGGGSAGSGPTVLWQRNVQTSILFIAISRDGSLIAAGGSQLVGPSEAYVDGMVYALNGYGAVLWNYSFPSSPPGPALFSPDDSRLVVRDQGEVVCFNATSGSIVWQQEIGGAAALTLSMNGNGTELAAGGGGSVYLLSMDDGHRLWGQPVPDGYDVGPVAISADGAYVAAGSVKTGTDGSVYFMDAKTGSLLWTRHVASDVLGASLSNDGSTAAFGTNYGVFLCNSSGTVLWNDTGAYLGALVVPNQSPSGGSDVFAGLGINGSNLVLINGSSGRAEWTSMIGNIRQIAVDGNATLAAVAAGPNDAGPFPPSGGTVYFFPLSKGIG